MRRPEAKDPTLVQVLSLFLLLLAFFIVLFNVSRADRGRTDAVGESLTSAFRTAGLQTTTPEIHASQSGEAPGPELALERLGDLVRTELRAAEIRVVRPGRLMQVRTATGDLFLPGSPELRAERGGFLWELARLVGTPVDGRRHKVEIYIGSDWITPDQMKGVIPVPISRAANLADQLIARGALAGTVMAGIRPDDDGTVTLLFRIDPEFRPTEAVGEPFRPEGVL